MMLGTLAALSGFLFMACGVSTSETSDPEETENLAEAEDALLSYPTTWTLTNSATQNLTFNCTCPKPYGLSNPAVMTTTTVSAGQSKAVQWSGWYNDGLGLNYCSSWSCKTTTSSGATYATATFSTGWGENITLKALTGGQLVRQ